MDRGRFSLQQKSTQHKIDQYKTLEFFIIFFHLIQKWLISLFVTIHVRVKFNKDPRNTFSCFFFLFVLIEFLVAPFRNLSNFYESKPWSEIYLLAYHRGCKRGLVRVGTKGSFYCFDTDLALARIDRFSSRFIAKIFSLVTQDIASPPESCKAKVQPIRKFSGSSWARPGQAFLLLNPSPAQISNE